MFNHSDSLFFRPKADRVVLNLPKQPYVAAVGQLLAAVPQSEADYDYYGYARTLTTTSAQGFASHTFKGNPVTHARKLLDKSGLFYRALGLGLKHVQLNGSPDVFNLPGGRIRVQFEQVLKISGHKRAVPVRGGFISVYMDGSGRVYQVTSTIRHGRKPRSTKRLINRNQAIKIAKKQHGVKDTNSVSCRLTLSAHNGCLDPVYEIVLSSNENGLKVWQYLVKATTREVVFGSNKLYYASEVKARALLRIPKPTEYKTDARDTVLKDTLPDPKFLRNERFDMLIKKSGKWQTVQALPDGTFNYDPDSAEFEAVTCFIAMNDSDAFAELCSGHKAKLIPVYIRDNSGTDNAYFDPSGWEIHMLVGSGLDRGGLFIYIGLDTGVSEHENGHKRVAVEAPGKDLPGSEGGGCHEAVGDYCDIHGEYRRMFLYGHLYGTPLTREAIKNDPRIIGVLALYPDGIRKQRNNKTIADKNGEPHNDGEIVGGAMCDVMEVMLLDEQVELEQALKNTCAILNVALQHVPQHKVMFRDMLRAFITADGLLFNGKYKAAIEKCFAAHGIKLTGKLDDPDALIRRRLVA